MFVINAILNYAITCQSTKYNLFNRKFNCLLPFITIIKMLCKRISMDLMACKYLLALINFKKNRKSIYNFFFAEYFYLNYKSKFVIAFQDLLANFILFLNFNWLHSFLSLSLFLICISMECNLFYFYYFSFMPVFKWL